MTTTETSWEPDRPLTARRGNLLVLTLVAAVVIYELTSKLTLSVVICCAESGIAYFRTGWWLRVNDSQKHRGRACFWFYVAAGFSRICATAFLIIAIGSVLFALVFAAVARFAPLKMPDPAPFLDQLLQAVCVLAISFVLVAVVTYVASALALLSGVKVWISPLVNEARRRGEFPPVARESDEPNYAGWLLILALIAAAVAVLLAALAPVIHLMVGNAGGWLIAALLIVGGLFAVAATEWFAKRVAADSIEDCWPAPAQIEPP